MKKIVIFGTGEGSKRFLEKNKDNFDVIAAFDNDLNKHGAYLNDIKIYNPSKIKNFEFDEIIIVSQWAKDIYLQLTENLNIDKNKIKVPPKKEIKEANRPFEDKNTRELAINIIKNFSKLAMRDNIVLYLDFGTLLGIVRDGNIIEWDDDIDFSISNTDKDLIDSWLRKNLDNFNLPVKIIIEKIKEVGYSIGFNNQDSNYKNFQISLSFRENENENSIHLPSKGMWYAPKKHFENFEIISFMGEEVFVPYDYKNYLTFLYGDWKIPKKDITMLDYANLGKVDYESF